MDRTPAGRAVILVGVAALIGGIFVLGVPVCPSATLLGIPCPGCGLTRATLLALHGDFGGALHMHPLVFILTPLVAYLVSSAAIGYVRGKGPGQTARARGFWTARATTVASSALVALMLTVWVARFFGFMGGHAPIRDRIGPARSATSAFTR